MKISKIIALVLVLLLGVGIGSALTPSEASGGGSVGGSASPPVSGDTVDTPTEDEYVAPERDEYSHSLEVYAPCCKKMYNVLTISHTKSTYGSYGTYYGNIHCCYAANTVPPELLIKHDYSTKTGVCCVDSCGYQCDHTVTKSMVDNVEQFSGATVGSALVDGVCIVCGYKFTDPHSYTYTCSDCGNEYDVRSYYNHYDLGAYGDVYDEEHSHDDGSYGGTSMTILHVYDNGTGCCDALGCGQLCDHKWNAAAADYLGKTEGTALVDGKCEICGLTVELSPCGTGEFTLDVECCSDSHAETVNLGDMGYYHASVCDSHPDVDYHAYELHTYVDGQCTGCYNICSHTLPDYASALYASGVITTEQFDFEHISEEYGGAENYFSGTSAVDQYINRCLICGMYLSEAATLSLDDITNEAALPPENTTSNEE